ncbi:MAG: GTP-binding protein [Bacteroidia bacterium]
MSEVAIEYLSFIEKQIESSWNKTFGDRNNEIVFIGQDMDEAMIKEELDACLATDQELATKGWEKGYADSWPVQRAYPL